MSKMFYGDKRLSPAPTLSIQTALNYSGENIIGYSYILSLKGYASSYRKTDDTPDSKVSVISIEKVLDSIAYTREALTKNGNDLILYDENNNIVLKAKGGILKSLNFNESSNSWTSYSEYTAELEFNEIDLIQGQNLNSILCDESFISNDSISSNIVDIHAYKIKSFTDSWNISTDDNLYNRILNIGNNQLLDIDNTSFNVSYTISVTGKHFFVESKLKPAWEQAKNFAQQRLHSQVTKLLSNVLSINASNACSADIPISDHGEDGIGILSNLGSTYNVFNETISCETSESDGSFSATYNAILKHTKQHSYHHFATKHTVSKSISIDDSARRPTRTISVQGTIEGLILGGLIRTSSSGFYLPDSGAIIVGSSASSKYNQALIGANKIISNRDLVNGYKEILGITSSALGTDSCITEYPKPSSFNLTHDYHNGTINYSIEYSSIKTLGQGDYANISIAVDKPVPVLAELNIPYSGVLIQDMNTVTANKISITIEGKVGRRLSVSGSDINYLLTAMNFTSVTLPSYLSSYILTQQQRTYNIIEGSYTINLAYICATGCIPS